MTGWQPIATAPKDDTSVLLFWSNYCYDTEGHGHVCLSIGSWKRNSRLARHYSDGSPTPHGAAYEKMGMAEEYFSDTDEMDDYGLSKAEHAPTHWMPLPEPPA